MADQREQRVDQPTRVFDYAQTDGDFWFDSVADLGDAFDPTMCVAWHLGRRQLKRSDIDPRLSVEPEFALPDLATEPPGNDVTAVLPRGRLLPEVAEDQPFRLLATWPSNTESRLGSGGWRHLLFDRGAGSLLATLAAIQLPLMWLAGVGDTSAAANARSVAETAADQFVSASQPELIDVQFRTRPSERPA